MIYSPRVLETARFITRVLGLTPLRPATEQSTVFRVAPDSMLLVVDPTYSRQTGRIAPEHGADGPGHMALRIAQADYEHWRQRLIECGVPIEREVDWPPGGKSIYFREPCGNSMELASGNVWGG